MRTNGLQKPSNGMQLTTWVLVPVLIVQFCLFLTPTLPRPISIPLTILFLSMGAASQYYGYITTKTDSIDTLLYQHLNGRPHPRAAKEQRGPGEKNESKTKYCWVCQTDVYESSMHCKYCDKCVSTFDHHCMYLNNCVGDANYATFYKTVWFVFLFIASHVAAIIIYLSLYFGGNQKTRELSDNLFGVNMPIIIVGFNIGFLVLTGFTGIFVIQLLWLHITLRRQQITTYEFIIRDGKEKREHWNLMQKVNQRRKEEILKAKEEGRCIQACWVGLGAKVCKPCDPIIPMVKKEMDEEDDENVEDYSSEENLAEDEKNELMKEP